MVRAHVLAQQSGTDIRLGRAVHNLEEEGSDDGVDTDTVLSELSDAQRRVAALAAVGYTNREISKKLHITISTVEQHLTSVYRKLRVQRIGLRWVFEGEERSGPRSELRGRTRLANSQRRHSRVQTVRGTFPTPRTSAD